MYVVCSITCFLGGKNNTRFVQVLKGLNKLIAYFGISAVGLVGGAIFVFLSGIIPFWILSPTLPPKMAYLIFFLTEFVLNYLFIVSASSYLLAGNPMRPRVQVLLFRTAVAFLPSLVMASIGGAIIAFRWATAGSSFTEISNHLLLFFIAGSIQGGCSIWGKLSSWHKLHLLCFSSR